MMKRKNRCIIAIEQSADKRWRYRNALCCQTDFLKSCFDGIFLQK